MLPPTISMYNDVVNGLVSFFTKTSEEIAPAMETMKRERERARLAGKGFKLTYYRESCETGRE